MSFGGWSGQPVPCWATPLGCGFTGRPDAEHAEHAECAEGFDDFMDDRVAKRSQKCGYAARPVKQTRADCRFETMINDSSHLSAQRDGFRAARPRSGPPPGAQRPSRIPSPHHKNAPPGPRHIPSALYKGPPSVVAPAYKHRAPVSRTVDNGMYIIVEGRRYTIHRIPPILGVGPDEYFYNTDDGKKWEVIRGHEGHFMTRPGQHR